MRQHTSAAKIEAVPHSSAHLNDKQLRVLRWIERGSPDGEYVDDNYGHRITSKSGNVEYLETSRAEAIKSACRQDLADQRQARPGS